MRDQAADAELEGVIGECERLDLPLKDTVRKALAGKGLFSIVDAMHRQRDPDEMALNIREEERGIYISRMAAMLHLTQGEAERLLDWMAADARERRDHCRHLRAHQSDRGTRMIYRCDATGEMSAAPWTERAPLLARFKADYCLTCGLRSSRVEPAQ